MTFAPYIEANLIHPVRRGRDPPAGRRPPDRDPPPRRGYGVHVDVSLTVVIVAGAVALLALVVLVLWLLGRSPAAVDAGERAADTMAEFRDWLRFGR